MITEQQTILGFDSFATQIVPIHGVVKTGLVIWATGCPTKLISTTSSSEQFSLSKIHAGLIKRVKGPLRFKHHQLNHVKD